MKKQRNFKIVRFDVSIFHLYHTYIKMMRMIMVLWKFTVKSNTFNYKKRLILFYAADLDSIPLGLLEIFLT